MKTWNFTLRLQLNFDWREMKSCYFLRNKWKLSTQLFKRLIAMATKKETSRNFLLLHHLRHHHHHSYHRLNLHNFLWYSRDEDTFLYDFIRFFFVFLKRDSQSYFYIIHLLYFVCTFFNLSSSSVLLRYHHIFFKAIISERKLFFIEHELLMNFHYKQWI